MDPRRFYPEILFFSFFFFLWSGSAPSVCWGGKHGAKAEIAWLLVNEKRREKGKFP